MHVVMHQLRRTCVVIDIGEVNEEVIIRSERRGSRALVVHEKECIRRAAGIDKACLVGIEIAVAFGEEHRRHVRPFSVAVGTCCEASIRGMTKRAAIRGCLRTLAYHQKQWYQQKYRQSQLSSHRFTCLYCRSGCGELARKLNGWLRVTTSCSQWQKSIG